VIEAAEVESAFVRFPLFFAFQARLLAQLGVRQSLNQDD
jgi:hypothetical protein